MRVLSNMVTVLGVIVTIGTPFFRLLSSRVLPQIQMWCDAFVRDLMRGKPAGVQLGLLFALPAIIPAILPFFVIAALCIELCSLDSLCLAAVLGYVHYAGFKHFTW